ncbi:MAG: SagB/ThcOx family dehydrogenase [Anaerolineales bacterium]|nr:SagB/ThcOx family dehydrogenase [Anaerolineales bacterium]
MIGQTLPEPRLIGTMTLEETILDRRSVREFTEESISEFEVSQLLWAAQGITDMRGYRSAPSAGALYPLELYVVLPEGVYHYDPFDHSLTKIRDGDLRKDLFEVSLRQDAILDAPMTMVITAVYARTEVKYGSSRTPRYVHLEAGHAAQNVLLQSVSLGLGAVPIGAFKDRQVQSVLGLPDDHEPLYLIPVGHPR